jgi:hypothetical protein
VAKSAKVALTTFFIAFSHACFIIINCIDFIVTMTLSSVKKSFCKGQSHGYRGTKARPVDEND